MENLNLGKYLKTGVLILVIGVVCLIGMAVVSKYNTCVDIETRFTAKMDERKAFYEKMSKILGNKAQVTTKNKEAYVEVITSIMAGRKDSEGLAMKWITEANPAANYSEVSELYKDLSRAVEAQREGFFEEEKMIQDIVREHNNILRMFPGNIVMWIFGTKPLEYKPISSDRTEEVFTTGKDNNTDLFK